MKRILALMLALLLALSLSACGGDDKPAANDAPASSGAPASQPVQSTPAPSTPVGGGEKVGGYAPGERTAELFGKKLCQLLNPVRMVLRMDIEMEEGKSETVDVTISIQDGVIATDFTSPAMGHIGTLYKDGKNYTIFHDQQMIMEQTTPAVEVPGGVGLNAEDYYDELSFTGGTEEINGKTYDYDEMTEATGDTTRVYFEPGTDKWAYMRTGDQLIEVLDYGNDPDPAAFTLPSGYTTMNVDSMTGGGLPDGMALPDGVELPEDVELPEGVTLPDGFKMP